MDRTNEALDRLTIDFSSGFQTPDYPSRLQAGPRITSLPGDAPQPAPVQASLPHEAAQPAPVQASLPGDAAQPTLAQAPVKAPAQPRAPKARQARSLEDIDQYLWRVYQRSATKRDSSGDFTWKDEAAAARLGLVTRQYVIGGMDADFRELLYDLGRAMDEAGLNWTILSGFRDDYRQGLASGYKAHVGNSFHGGSRATGGYGHGCAADIKASDGESGSNDAVWKWVDQHGQTFGIFRPMKQNDPAHIQPLGGWHDVAFNLRGKRETAQNGYLTASLSGADAEKVTTLVDTPPSRVSEAQFDCVRSHRSGFRLAGLSHQRSNAAHAFPMGDRMHRASLSHSGRMHRSSRRRMVVDAGSPDKSMRAGAWLVADRTGAAAKAEAADKSQRDANRHKVADTGRWEKQRPGAAGQDARGRKVAESVNPQKRAAAETSEPQAKAKSRVADREEASNKNNKKL